MTMEKGYHALDIDFEIPEILEQDIADFLRNLNEEGGNLADCHEEEIRNILNECSRRHKKYTGAAAPVYEA